MTSKFIILFIIGQGPNFHDGQKFARVVLGMNKPLLGQREGTPYTQAVPLAPQKRGHISGYNDISYLCIYKN